MELQRDSGTPYTIITGWLFLGMILVAAGTAFEQANNPPACSGIGWGCHPDPLTTALLAGITIGLPVSVILALVAGVTQFAFGVRSSEARLVAWVVPPVLAVGALLVLR